MRESKEFLVTLVLSSLLGLAGCAGEISDPEPYDPDTPPGRTAYVPVWVQEHRDLNPDDVEAGCDMWVPVGMSCVVTSDPGAPVRVFVSDAPCIADTKGSVTLATAFGDGTIVFENMCLRRDLIGRIDRQMFMTIMGHEFGHELGVWMHVPRDCAEPHQEHPRSGPVCGPAIMNPFHDATLNFLTVPDALAFDLRVADAPAFPPYGAGGHSHGGEICVLRSAE